MSSRLLLRFVPLFTLGFLYGVFASAPGFYHTQYLLSFGLTEATVGIAFAAVAVVATLCLLLLPTIVRTIKARATTILVGVLYILAALLMVASTNTTHALISFGLLLSTSLALFSLLDIFIETKTGSAEEHTGRIRGLYLSIVNAGFVAGPLMGGAIIAYAALPALYLTTALVTIVFLLIIISTTTTFKDPEYPRHNLRALIHDLKHSVEIRKSLWINLMLRTLYGAVLTYFGIYVITYADIPATTLGVMASISIIPFVLFQYPLGVIADKIGERDLMAIGCAITLFGLLLIPIVPLTALWLTIALTIVHAGAAFIELLVESHFFKQVQGKNTALIASFRLMMPLAYLTGPLIGTVVLMVAPIQGVFVALAALLLMGVPLALSLRH